jgi:hypothetical protein
VDEQHELGHELRDIIASTVEAFVTFQREQGVRVSLAATLLALEMEASVARRSCRDAGATKEQLKEIQQAASKCASAIYEDMVESEDSTKNNHTLN